MQVVTHFNLTHVLSHSLKTISEPMFSSSLIFQEFAKLIYTLNLKISKSQNLTSAKISLPKVITQLRYRHFCTTGLSHFLSVAPLSSPATLIQWLMKNHLQLLSATICFILMKKALLLSSLQALTNSD